MIEIRFHGRGGQGAVTSAEILATSAISAGKFAQAFPSFGPERRGAPVIAFARISEEKIENRSAILEPDVVVVLDPALIGIVKVAEGLKKNGTLVLNSTKKVDEIRKITNFDGNIAIVDGSRIAMEIIGTNITNMVMLGALAKVVEVIPPEKIEENILHRLGENLGKKNVSAFKKAFEETTIFQRKS